MQLTGIKRWDPCYRNAFRRRHFEPSVEITVPNAPAKTVNVKPTGYLFRQAHILIFRSSGGLRVCLLYGYDIIVPMRLFPACEDERWSKEWCYKEEEWSDDNDVAKKKNEATTMMLHRRRMKQRWWCCSEEEWSKDDDVAKRENKTTIMMSQTRRMKQRHCTHQVNRAHPWD